MIPISQRLRARLEPIGDGSGKWRPDGLCQEAADVNDALVAALIVAQFAVGAMQMLITAHGINSPIDTVEVITRIDAALAKAKGKQE
jgi:hypothetical protein